VDTPAERNAAYAEFLAGLADLREDLATGRFDAAVAALETDGRLERGEAARLRYWQRESLRTQADQLVSAAAASLAALDRARAEAAASLASADAVWDLRRDDEAAAPAAEPTIDDSSLSDLTIVLTPAPPDASLHDDPSSTSDDRSEDADDSVGSPIESAGDGTSTPPSNSRRGRHRAPAHAQRGTESGDLAPEPMASPSPARRRRLLVAGLTVVDNSDVPSDSDPHEQPAVG
jgi:hypothetical protein